ncbi:30S ribosomal protein S1 [candidate division LCP-89 bacterium B3_LCP]|uniref:Small ribosomal subunit protein bS1 n=1 Tax=candidate division LCP-89 bacterium B3_LCP TaxID=2012998 RepID=A0A532UZG2_UNCL8|nr:MAG: 30S ribosomal protein S1 [candidate division LCP-89 bacterium B3_LCP]
MPTEDQTPKNENEQKQSETEKPELTSDQDAEPTPEKQPEQTPEQQPEQTLEQESEQTPEKQPEPTPKQESEPTPEKQPEQIPDQKTEAPVTEIAAQDKLDDEPERVVKLADLQEEVEYNDDEIAFMSKLYEDTMQQIKPGEIILGKIVSISDREVAIDIGFKSEGTVPIEEFEDRENLNIGDEIEVYLEDIEDQDGQLVLSKKRADFARIWENIMGVHERGETIVGRCMRRIKGGIVVDVMGIDAFLPGSQIDIHPVRDFDSWIGESCDFRIVKVNEIRKNIVLSRKVLIEDNLRDVREKILSEIQIGQELEGVVKNITDFGAFVDLGGVDGLLHITDLSWGRVNHPSEIVSYDENLKVRILDFDPVRKRISVGLKQLQPHPWEGVEERFPVNSKVMGKVVSITKYGAFIELEDGIEGLIHISEMSWTQHIKHPSQILNIGQEIEIIVLSIDVEGRKVSLGLKQTEEDPWEKLEQKYIVNSIHKGIVRDLVPFGAFIELEEGVEGLVHISDLSWTRKVRHPGEIVKKGDEIDVQIIAFDRNERRIALGHKQTLENPWIIFEKKYPTGSVIDGTVVRTVDKGAIIGLEWSLESFLPVSHFGKDKETGKGRALQEGESLRVEIIDLDIDNKKIVVSAANVQKRADEADYQAYLAEQKEDSESDTPETEVKAEEETKPAVTEETSAEEEKKEDAKPEEAASEEEKTEEAPVVDEKQAEVKEEKKEDTKPAEAVSEEEKAKETPAPEVAPVAEKEEEKPEEKLKEEPAAAEASEEIVEKKEKKAVKKTSKPKTETKTPTKKAKKTTAKKPKEGDEPAKEAKPKKKAATAKKTKSTKKDTAEDKKVKKPAKKKEEKPKE